MIRVRPGRDSDREQLRRIQQSALPEYAPELLESEIGGAVGLLVAEDQNPVGYALFVPSGTEVALLELAIEPTRQDEGIGSTLLEETCARLGAAGHESIRLTARGSDKRVHRFYERHGFKQQGRLPDFFETDEGLVFLKHL